jgi:single-stranded-DNA-specific exonuclease
MIPENVEAFSKKFEEVVSNLITEDLLIPEIIIDTKINFKDINQSFYNIISQMEPYGPENMRPVFIVEKVEDTGYSDLLKEQHIRFNIKQNNIIFSGIGFNMPDKLNIVKSGKPFDIVFTLDENEWKGNKRLQLMVIDCRISS